MLRRHFLSAASLSAVAPASSLQAQAWPTGRVTIIVPFPAGAATDITGRVVADRLGQVWGQAVVVDNKGAATVCRPPRPQPRRGPTGSPSSSPRR